MILFGIYEFLKCFLIYIILILLILLCVKLQFEDSVVNSHPKYKYQDSNFKSTDNMRIQDKGYLEMVDEGRCLSMHQPWASLLVAGIKMYVKFQISTV